MLTMIFSKTLKENLEMLKSTPFFILVIGLEIILSNYHHRKLYNWKETATNFSLSLVNGGFDLLIRGAYLLVLSVAWDNRAAAVENGIVYWAALVLSIDFLMYWLHRLEHYCRLFWAGHVTHHSAEHMNASVE